MRCPIPFRQRPFDWALSVFFLVNLTFITYIVDVEQLIIADPSNFQYPLWPPAPLVDLVHWWGKTFDPVLLARPTWWKMTIWIDSIFFGPFYAVALFAYVRGRDWIRIPSIIWGSVMITNVTIILGEEMMGPHATFAPGMVWLANLAWLVFPVLVIARMWLQDHPFTVEARDAQARSVAG
jgi:hypothetical protein